MRRRALWFVALIALVVAWAQIFMPIGLSVLQRQVAAESGLSVTLGAPQGLGFDPRIGGTEPTKWQSLLALRGLEEAASEYPQELLEAHAPQVLIAGRLEILDLRVGGTVQPGWVLLATDYLGPGAGGEVLAEIYHHEVSSLLIAARPFPDDAWRAALPEGFAYPDDDAERLQATQSYADDLTPFFADGFVSDYGASSLENDINTYAALLLSDPDGLAALAADHPAIATKAQLIRSYYAALHPEFAARFGG